MDLHIDTTEFGKVTFSLAKSRSEQSGGSQNKSKNKLGMTKRKSYKVIPQESDKILEYLSDFMTSSRIKDKARLPDGQGLKINKILVYKKKTGSFTGLRIAVAIAQALSFAWGVKAKVINNK